MVFLAFQTSFGICFGISEFCLQQPLEKKVSNAPTVRAQIVILILCLSPNLNIFDLWNSCLMNKSVVEDTMRVSSKCSIVLKCVFKFYHIILKQAKKNA